MIDLGVVQPGSTIRIPFSTFNTAGAAVTMTNFVAADILIYKDGGTTERASTSGFTATTDFDSKTGKHVAVIDLSDNTTADFFAAGSEYLVAIDSVTVDSQTVGAWIGKFTIGYRAAVHNTTIATLSSQTSFTLTAGPADDSALVGCVALVHDAASAVQRAIGVVSAYTGSTKTVTLAADPAIFTMAAKDNISFFVPSNTRFVGGTVQTARDIGASVVVGSISNNAITASSINADAITAAKIADGAIDAATFAAGAINAAAIAADAIGASELAADAVAEIAAGVWDLATSGHTTSGTFGAAMNAAGSAGDPWGTSLPGAYSSGTAGYIVGTNLNATVSSRLATSGYTAPTNLTAAQIATGVWTDTTAGDFTTSLSIGKSIMNGVSLGTGLTIARCTLTDTLTTYTGNTPQTGDCYPKIDTEVATIITNIAALNNLSAAQVNAEVLDVIGTDTLVAGVTIKEALRRQGALLSGKVTNAGTGTETFKDYAESVSTIVIVVDSSGNRTAITYN